MKRTLFGSGLLALAASISLHATTLTFTDQAQWSAQVINLTNFDGGSLSPGQFQVYGTSGGLVVADLQILGLMATNGNPWYDLVMINAGPTQPYYDWGSGTILRSGDRAANITAAVRLNFSTPVSAFGFNYGGGGGDTSITIAPVGMTPIDAVALARPNYRFFGVVSDSQTFTSVNIIVNTMDRYLVLDNIARGSYNPPAAPPPPPPTETVEPGTLLQLALGSGLMALARQRVGGKA